MGKCGDCVWIFLLFIISLFVIIIGTSFYNSTGMLALQPPPHSLEENGLHSRDSQVPFKLINFINTMRNDVILTVHNSHSGWGKTENSKTAIPPSGTAAELLNTGDIVVAEYQNVDGSWTKNRLSIFGLTFDNIFISYAGMATDNSVASVTVNNESESRILIIERTHDGRRVARAALSPGSIMGNILVPELTTIEIVLAANENSPKRIIKVVRGDNNIVYHDE